MTSTTEPKRTRWRRRLLRTAPLAVLLLGLLVTWLTVQQQQQNLDAVLRVRFDREVERTKAAIVARMAAYEDLLHNANALFAADESVTRDEWRGYVSVLPLAERYPGMTGVGLIVEVPGRLLGAFENSARLEGAETYQIRPRGARDVYLPVRYVEPLAENRALLGFDMGADPAIRTAAEWARDNGQAILTPKLTLGEAQQSQSGFFILVPVYHRNLARSTVEQRRAALIGWVFAPVRAEALLKGILGPGMPEIDLEIFDGSEPAPADLLYDSAQGMMPASYPPTFAEKQFLTISSRPWTLGFTTLPGFDLGLNRDTPIQVGALGVILSALLAGLTFVLGNNQALAEARAEQMTLTVRENEAKLRRQNEFLGALQATRLGLLSQQPLEDTLFSIVERAADLAGTGHGYLFQLEPGANEMVMKVGSGFFAQRVGDRIKPGQSVAGIAWQTAQPLVVNDYPHWPGRVPSPVFDRLHSLAGVPLRHTATGADSTGEQVVGVIGLGFLDTEQGHFAEEDISRLAQIGELASLALENAKLFGQAEQELAERTRAEEELRTARDELEVRVEARTSELRKSNEELAVVNELASALAQQHELEPLLDMIHRQIQNVMPSDAFFVRLLDERTGWLVPLYDFDDGQRYHPEPVRAEPQGQQRTVLETGESILINRTSDELRDYKLAPGLASGNRQKVSASLMFVPLRMGERLAGVLSVQSYALNAYSQRDLLRLGAISNYIAVAIDSARLFSLTHERAQRLSQLARSALDLTSAQVSGEALLEIITRNAMDLFDVDGSGIWVPVSPDEIELKCSINNESAELTGRRLKKWEGLAGKVFATAQLLRVDDYLLWANRALNFADVRFHAAMAVPMLWQNRLVGVLALTHSQAGRVFTVEDENTAQLYASQAAAALQNLQLVSELEQRVRQRTLELSYANARLTDQNEFMEALHETTLSLMNRLDVSDVLQSIVSRAAALANTKHGYLFQLVTESEMQMQVGTGFFGQRVGDRILPGQSVAGRAWQSGEPLAVNDYANWEGRVPHPVFDQLKRLMAVPLVSGSKVIGVLGLGHVRTEHTQALTVTEITRLSQFAELATIALDNARLYTEAQEELEQRKRVERDLRQSEERTRLIVDTALDAIITIDERGHITGWNPQAERTFGWSSTETVGQPLDETIIPLRYREAHRRGLQHFLVSGSGPMLGKTTEIEAVHRDGHEFPVELEISPVQQGNTFTFSAFVRDITERKRFEKALASARDAALEASRVKSEFLANMSHEIRTPMNAVIGMTGLLANTKLDTRQRYFIETIRSSSDTLLTIINDILDLSKMEAGKLVLERIDFEPLSALEEAAELLVQRAREKNLSLMTFVSPDIPRLVKGDPVRLRQVLLNLMGNALKFTEHGEVVVRADLESLDETQVTLRFKVTDTGIGLSGASREQLFQPFTQADGSTTRKYGGTGLGLSISKHLVDIMHGEIDVDSVEGKGSTFWFTARFERSTAPDATQPLNSSLQGRRALVIDDSPASRDILRSYMTAWGIQCRGVTTTEEGLHLLRRASAQGDAYQVAIVNLSVAGMDVFTFAHHVRNEPALRETGLILLTDLDEQGLGQRAVEGGFAQYLTKPVKQSVLYDTLASVIFKGAAPAAATPMHVSRAPKDGSAPVTSILSSGENLILIAEDHPVNREVALLQLQQLGLAARAVENGREAVEAVQRVPYALVLMDCQMPEIDGYEATRAIRRAEAQSGRHVPIVAMTAHAMQGDREACLAAGMDDYLSKPVTMEKLEQTLRRWMPNVKLLPLAAAPPARNGNHETLASDTVIDFKVIDDLRAMQGDDPTFLRNLVNTFFTQSGPLLESMRSTVNRGDVEALRQAAHKLKGGCAVLGARSMANVCYDIEMQARLGKLDGVLEKIERAEGEYEQVKTVLIPRVNGGRG